MLRITGKNFVVGLAYGSLKIIHTAAPMVRYMLGWKVAMRDVNTPCPQCHGYGAVSDDPEVPGSMVECWKCNGRGGFIVPCCEDNDDGVPKCDGTCINPNSVQ